MGRSNARNVAPRRAPKDLGRRIKKKPCALCRDAVKWVDYKDLPLLRKYMSDRGKIRSRRVTGNCAQHQRDLAMAIKTARELILLPYTQRTVAERPGGRGGGRSGPGREGRPGGRPERSDQRERDAADEALATAVDVADDDEAPEDVVVGAEPGAGEVAP